LELVMLATCSFISTTSEVGRGILRLLVLFVDGSLRVWSLKSTSVRRKFNICSIRSPVPYNSLIIILFSFPDVFSKMAFRSSRVMELLFEDAPPSVRIRWRNPKNLLGGLIFVKLFALRSAV